MCLLIWQGPGTYLPDDHIVYGWDNNPDGGGYAFIDQDSRIQVRKFMDLDDFMFEYRLDHKEFGETSPFLVHFRFGTHGNEDITNVHPFWLGKNKQTVVAHNGVLDPIMDKNSPKSDTRVFVDEYLASLPVNWVDNDYLVDMVEDYIVGSKLVVLTVNPMHQYDSYIFRAQDGHWDDDVGIWYSNNTYKPSVYRVIGTSDNGKLYDLADTWAEKPKGKSKDGELGNCPICNADPFYIEEEYDACWHCECCLLCELPMAECWCYTEVKQVLRKMDLEDSQEAKIHDMTDEEVAALD